MEDFDLILWFQENFEIILFVSIQIILLIYARHNLTKKNAWHTHTNIWASILTVIGVFGTFLGIYFGLLDFDHKNIEGSIPTLLDGLKHAFLTSLVGIVSAIFLKFRALLHEKKDLSSDGIKEFVETLTDTLKKVETSGESNLSAKLDKLTETFKGESNETRKVLDSIKTELTNGQKEQGEQTRKTLTEMQSEIIEGQSATNTHLHSLTETVNGEGSETRKVLDSIKTELTNEQKEQGEQTRKTLTDMQSEIIEGQSATNTHLHSLTETVNGESIETRKVLDSMKTELTNEQKEQGEQTRKTLTDIQSAFTEKQNKTFIQLRTLTKTVSYEHNQLRKEFEAFSNNVAERIANLANEELVGALKTVIDEFNTNMVDQFGDNFRHLNEAVDRMVGWQEQYRQQMDQLASEFRIAAESIEQSRGSLENITESSSTIADRSHSIVDCAENLEPILHTMNDQLEAFSRLREQAHEAFPLIEERLNELTNGLSSTVQEAITNSQTSMEAQREAFQGQSEQLQSIINGLDNFTEQIEEVTGTVSTTINNLQHGYVSMQGNLVSMQETLEQQLTESVNTLAGKLAALSEKFVEDYTPLTERLRKVLAIAEGILPRNSRN